MVAGLVEEADAGHAAGCHLMMADVGKGVGCTNLANALVLDEVFRRLFKLMENQISDFFRIIRYWRKNLGSRVVR